ncbi:methyltransferase [Hydrogenobacter sp. T-2]|uniref:tRNA1(Val) (adenine(37)-N6)-methyltransferase n=1 Tax=Pampinifervens diazotrophicum TaxID=1632018 RepID=UPI002B263BE5|nr:methyltransferase [Hydrogenobacter sp. T-2]WPM31870.1 methyltransferase [Hydrogenobacter sp. T-2]
MEGSKEFEFFRGKVRFKQPKAHKLSIVEILFVANLKGIRRSSKVLDLGAGFGTLSILISLKYSCKVWAMERNPIMLQLLRENIKLNKLEDKIHVLDLDLRHIQDYLKAQSFDVVVANPPFYKGSLSTNEYHHETDTSLEDFIKTASFLLKDGRHFNLLVASNRLTEAIIFMKKYRLEIESLRFFYPKLYKNAKIVCIHALKNLRPLPVVEKPLIINEESGEYTQEVKSLLESFL